MREEGDEHVNQLSFIVEGKPQPKQRPRVTRNGTFTPRETREYERRVRVASFLRALAERLERTHERGEKGNMLQYVWSGPVRVELRLFWPTERKGDGDNAYKSVADALQPRLTRRLKCGFGLLRDDKQIREHHVYEHVDRARPRAEVVVTLLEAA
jgi:Holliday junction resolvase RusA-like endonuclease